MKNIADDFRRYADAPIKGTNMVPISSERLREAAELMSRAMEQIHRLQMARQVVADVAAGLHAAGIHWEASRLRAALSVAKEQGDVS